jgi:hypothetical protein
MAASFVPSDVTCKMSEIIINHEPITKVDCLVRIDLYGFWHYTIFRRYNSPYDIIVEDINKNIVLLESSSTATIRNIVRHLRDILPSEADGIYIANNYALEFGISDAIVTQYALDIPLIEIQKYYSGLYLNLEGVPSTPTPAEVNAPASEGLLALQIPKSDPEEFYQAPSDKKELSMRVADVTLRAIGIVGEINELIDEVSAEYEEDCMVLRSGRRVYKI